MQRLIYHVWLKRESLLRDNRSHAPVEVRSKCLDLSRFYIADIDSYRSGVFNNPTPPFECMAINLAVTIIGWDDDKQAWLIKNSWGPYWGEKGYMWIGYKSNNIGCGAAWVDATTVKQ
ncbi:hypothetical protein OGM63_01455 [Plectonema radiosum NIES-515]|uniref:Peptidase C1A papain C-terminal domain-containing protein n=1 Tax=Plectonema radiosum NIES-515 TaxID=2986073 RepID=A0ABT3ASV6_9CYAN|nr:C1 family peptidase [Plectonema radiosum]MCV3212204.1 hypothetical protein [Plectonema radiosum NIES-515]